MRKLFLIITFIVVAILLAIWSPWNNWDISLTRFFGITPPEEMGGLQVSSLAGELEVFIDNESMGTVTPSESPLFIPAITPGEHLIMLERISDVEGAYAKFNRLVEFAPDVDVILAYELGPTESFSEGHVIFADEVQSVEDNVLLYLDSDTEGINVVVDGIEIGSNPIVGVPLSISKQHDVVVSKEGYDPHEFKLLPDDQTDRDELEGYEINVDVNLFLQPIQVGGI